jgi:hypothetical protein
MWVIENLTEAYASRRGCKQFDSKAAPCVLSWFAIAAAFPSDAVLEIGGNARKPKGLVPNIVATRA